MSTWAPHYAKVRGNGPWHLVDLGVAPARVTPDATLCGRTGYRLHGTARPTAGHDCPKCWATARRTNRAWPYARTAKREARRAQARLDAARHST